MISHDIVTNTGRSSRIACLYGSVDYIQKSTNLKKNSKKFFFFLKKNLFFLICEAQQARAPRQMPPLPTSCDATAQGCSLNDTALFWFHSNDKRRNNKSPFYFFNNGRKQSLASPDMFCTMIGINPCERCCKSLYLQGWQDTFLRVKRLGGRGIHAGSV